MEFHKGDEIAITDQSGADWWTGRRVLDGKTGTLPASYVVPKVQGGSLARTVSRV